MIKVAGAIIRTSAVTLRLEPAKDRREERQEGGMEEG